ncbi:MAG: bifunctional riboflavin kinase/FAD synthetase [Solobacterium sp.]|nr:bifunctional riboflavin kinase/FAD synthetase [Solobacterium sp.]
MRIITVAMDTRRKSMVPICACIGYFDGMHLGHQELIRRTVEMAHSKNCESALITFDPDPWVTVRDMEDVKHITTLRQRMNLAVDMGIGNIVILKFTKAMSQLEPEEFVARILGKLNLQGLVCGFDFHYGHMGKGDCYSLSLQAEYPVDIVDAVTDENGKISSTRISECIVNARFKEASLMMGRPYEIEGTVIHGRHKGSSMGFPTANIKYAAEYLLPRSGVYACYVLVDKKRYPAMVNLGHNPTLNYQERLSLEAHLIGFTGNLYGKHMTVQFVKFMRPEKKFRNSINLILQLEQDLRDIRRLLERYEKGIS